MARDGAQNLKEITRRVRYVSNECKYVDKEI